MCRTARADMHGWTALDHGRAPDFPHKARLNHANGRNDGMADHSATHSTRHSVYGTMARSQGRPPHSSRRGTSVVVSCALAIVCWTAYVNTVWFPGRDTRQSVRQSLVRTPAGGPISARGAWRDEIALSLQELAQDPNVLLELAQAPRWTRAAPRRNRVNHAHPRTQMASGQLQSLIQTHADMAAPMAIGPPSVEILAAKKVPDGDGSGVADRSKGAKQLHQRDLSIPEVPPSYTVSGMASCLSFLWSI